MLYLLVCEQDDDVRIIMVYFYEDKAIATLCQVSLNFHTSFLASMHGN